MIKENKRKLYEKGYFKITPATILLHARFAEDWLSRKEPEAITAIIAPIASQAFMLM